MKANEAPKKIYMTPSFGEPDNVLLASFSKSHLDFHRDVEYTRTDAFIEKAKNFLWEHIDGTDYHINYILKEFEKYMKGE